MKNTSFAKGLFIAAIAVLGISQSCNDLDLQPLDQVTNDTYYKTAADFDGAIFAAYSSIQDIWGTSTEDLSERGEFWSVSLVATDDVQTNSKAGNSGGDYQNARDLDALQFRPTQTCWGAAYNQIYEGILRANIVIEAVARPNELTDAQKKSFVAEAKFVRGFLHFLALQMWGTPPLVLEVKKDINDLISPNATQEALYAAILSDFADAARDLPPTWDAANLGRATKWAARAFEGKVHVWKRTDWAAAVTALQDVKMNGGYSLYPDYNDAFSFTKENGQESIFEIQYGGPFSDDNLWVFDDTHSEAFKASQGTGRVWYWNPSEGAGAPGGGLGWFIPTQDLVDEFEPGDKRLPASIYRAGDTFYIKGDGTATYDAAWSETGYSIRKYFGEQNAVSSAYSPNGQAGFNNERWFRYAEVLLLLSEALIESGQTGPGLDILNDEIRARAGLGDTQIADPKEALRHERRCELAFEAHRWFDIVRWGIGPDVFSNWDPKYNLFPFPQSEINRSAGKVVQNPGYD
jgi:starch-binding outer membrane protein, SusD/RagB family